MNSFINQFAYGNHLAMQLVAMQLEQARADQEARRTLRQTQPTQLNQPTSDPVRGRTRSFSRTGASQNIPPVQSTQPQDPLNQPTQQTSEFQRGSFPGLAGGPAIQPNQWNPPIANTNQPSGPVASKQFEDQSGYLDPNQQTLGPVEQLVSDISQTSTPVAKVIKNEATPQDQQEVKKMIKFFRMKTETSPSGIVRPTSESVRAFFDFMKDLRTNDPERFDYVFSNQAVMNTDLAYKRSQAQLAKSQSEQLIQLARKTAQDILKDEQVMDIIADITGIQRDKLFEELKQFRLTGSKLPEQLEAQLNYITAQTQALELANQLSTIELDQVKDLDPDKQLAMQQLMEMGKLVGIILSQGEEKTFNGANNFAAAFLLNLAESVGFQVTPGSKGTKFTVTPPAPGSLTGTQATKETQELLRQLASGVK